MAKKNSLLRKGAFLAPIIAVVMVAAGSLDAQARFGSSRSFGSRGSRSVTPRSYGSGGFSSGQTSPRFGSGASPYSQSNPSTMARPMPAPSTGMGGGFWRGMAGGLAGGFLGSMLFRNLGYGGYGGMGYGGGAGGGIGILEILLIGGLIFLIFRFVVSRAASTGGAAYSSGSYETSARDALNQVPRGPFAGATPRMSEEEEAVDTIRRYDANFDPARFKDARVDDFFRIQAAWGNRDLTSVRELLAPEIQGALTDELESLKRARQVNRIENVTVRQTQILEAWQEFGKEYVTLRFYANLLDYTTDETTGAVVAGDKNHPVKFEEYWTYVREIGNPSQPWRLSAVEQQA